MSKHADPQPSTYDDSCERCRYSPEYAYSSSRAAESSARSIRLSLFVSNALMIIDTWLGDRWCPMCSINPLCNSGPLISPSSFTSMEENISLAYLLFSFIEFFRIAMASLTLHDWSSLFIYLPKFDTLLTYSYKIVQGFWIDKSYWHPPSTTRKKRVDNNLQWTSKCENWPHMLVRGYAKHPCTQSDCELGFAVRPIRA